MNDVVRTEEPLWSPSAERIETARLTHFRHWLSRELDLRFDGYEELWEWSVGDRRAFWAAVWKYFDIDCKTSYTSVLENDVMPGAKWFSGAEINFVSQVFRHRERDNPAIIFRSESFGEGEISWSELERQVASFAAELKSLGVGRGDRVCAYLPSTPHAVIAFLATASVGAIWSIAAPEMGVSNILTRFKQIEPKVLIACNGYVNGGRRFERSEERNELVHALPTLDAVIEVDLLGSTAAPAYSVSRIDWDSAVSRNCELEIDYVPFDHPLWVLYSSGTTGLPKAIVHDHGGQLLTQLVSLDLHMDISAGDRVMWTVSTGWMVWNTQISALLVGATIVLYDGNAGGDDLSRPDWYTLWRYIAAQRITAFGTGAAFHGACLKQGLEPGKHFDLSCLRMVGSTGSPLSPEAYRWIYDNVHPDTWLCCASGGTDICSAFINGTPILPIYMGEMQCRNLGNPVYAFNAAGEAVYEEVGELVCTAAIPGMPLYFWGDADNKRYLESYFDEFKSADGSNVWRHGDWLKLIRRKESVTSIIYGRSDSTINRHGIRMGTAEIYDPVEAIPDIIDSLVIDLEYLGKESRLLLFVQLAEGCELDDALIQAIRGAIRDKASARMIPNDIYKVPLVPRNLTGKKLEVPIRKMLLGQPMESVMTRDVLADQTSIDWFIDFAAKQNTND